MLQFGSSAARAEQTYVSSRRKPAARKLAQPKDRFMSCLPGEFSGDIDYTHPPKSSTFLSQISLIVHSRKFRGKRRA